jgi:hypothetical protein
MLFPGLSNIQKAATFIFIAEARMNNQPSPNPDTEDLSAHIERALGLRAAPVDPIEAQRLLKHLRRLEPAAQRALADAAAGAPDFGASLRALGAQP